MKLKLKEAGERKEIFTTDSPRIKEVIFTYAGSDDNLTEILKVMIIDYARKKKIID